MHDLPGTDPRFHESRNYLSPVVLRGEEILASHGSCKEAGCNYRSAWTTNAARDRGMWLHRAMKVREARVVYFYNLFPDNAKVGQLFLETAEVTLADLPDYDTYLDWQVGTFALDAVNKVLAHAATF